MKTRIAAYLLGLITVATIAFGVRASMMQPARSVREIVLTPLGYPYPYQLQFVAQYRFVDQIGEFLVRRDRNQQIVGGAAESWTISDDRRHITFHLRPGLYSAEEVRQSLVRLMKSGQTAHSNLAAQVVGIDVDGTLNIQITTNGDAAAILSPLVMADAVIAPDAHWISVPGIKEVQIDWTKTRGPYVWKSGSLPIKPGETIVFTPNKDHYFYQPEQLDWIIQPFSPGSIESLDQLNQEIAKSPSWATVRYSNQNKMIAGPATNMPFFETRPNGIAYVQLNVHTEPFNDKQARLEVLRRLFKTKLDLLPGVHRTFQIPQPGMVGRISEDSEDAFRNSFGEESLFRFLSPIRWALPSRQDEDSEWHRLVVEGLGIPVNTKKNHAYPNESRWLSGDVQAGFFFVGMGDEDPISGASFLFSESGNNADLPDHRIMNLLNSGKETNNRERVGEIVRKAFKMALDEAVIVPLYHFGNRHYHSDSIELNISDQFSESIHIWDVRLK